MADIKCGRCDRHYSKFRSRCPYCGAAKHSKGKRAVGDENNTWKVTVGVSVIVLLIAAVAALLIMTVAGENAPDVGGVTPPVSGGNDSAGGIDSVQGQDPQNPNNQQQGGDTPVTPPEPVLNSIVIRYGLEERTDVSMKEQDVLQFNCGTDPDDYEGTPVWSSSDENIFIVLQSGEITAIKAGTATLTCTLDGKVAECIIRVRAR